MVVQNNANIGFEKQIWDAACVLWGHIPAAEYRKVIVGLIFLRYISSAFENDINSLLMRAMVLKMIRMHTQKIIFSLYRRMPVGARLLLQHILQKSVLLSTMQ